MLYQYLHLVDYIELKNHNYRYIPKVYDKLSKSTP